jgi:hypothetical protein
VNSVIFGLALTSEFRPNNARLNSSINADCLLQKLDAATEEGVVQAEKSSVSAVVSKRSY